MVSVPIPFVDDLTPAAHEDLGRMSICTQLGEILRRDAEDIAEDFDELYPSWREEGIPSSVILAFCRKEGRGDVAIMGTGS